MFGSGNDRLSGLRKFQPSRISLIPIKKMDRASRDEIIARRLKSKPSLPASMT
jgi:hypothetical protein